MKIAVIIPTYNEKENIERLINAIFSLNIGGLEVIVVDDNSPDDTAIAVKEIMSANPKIHLICRKGKMGLGTAYLEGFRYAIEYGADYLFEMDADLSHDPKQISLFLSHIDQNDLVIGSRYVSSGRIDNWDIHRRLVSSFGNLYARLILGVAVRDLTTGYKCYRRQVVEYLMGKDIDADGYVFQVETTYHAIKGNFRVKEIPIIFTERRLGKSKFNFNIIWESFWKVLKLRLINSRHRI
jgi:dolichol-phosphate mannosyltransferase